MSVHQVDEFYVHIYLTDAKTDAVRTLSLDNFWDYDIDSNSITVNGFYSEEEAKYCDVMIQDVLSC